MSNRQQKEDKNKTSQELQQEYAKICTALGQALFAERAAQKQQVDLEERQDALNEAFIEASQREHAEAAKKAKEEAKSESSGPEQTP